MDGSERGGNFLWSVVFKEEAERVSSMRVEDTGPIIPVAGGGVEEELGELELELELELGGSSSTSTARPITPSTTIMYLDIATIIFSSDVPTCLLNSVVASL